MEVREEVRQLAEPLAEELGLELVDIEQASSGHHRVVRVFLDKPGGVTVDDCARFSRRLTGFQFDGRPFMVEAPDTGVGYCGNSLEGQPPPDCRIVRGDRLQFRAVRSR